jgi:hypothetical protein
MPVVRRDGCDLHYDVQGEGPPLVLAAGLGGAADWWIGQIPRYAREFTVLSFDQRGTGRSSRIPVASVEQMAGDVAAILDHAGIARAHCPGHSIGGAIGLPDLVSSIWAGLHARAGSPPAAIARLNAEVTRILSQPELRARLEEAGFEIRLGTPQALASLQAEDTERLGAIIRASGARLE